MLRNRYFDIWYNHVPLVTRFSHSKLVQYLFFCYKPVLFIFYNRIALKNKLKLTPIQQRASYTYGLC